MRISLIINTYNRMRTLPSTLRSLEFLRYSELEVIVVDGPSSDGTLFYLQTHWADKIKICTCDETNLSKSRNIGIKNATGEVICFIDDDGVPEPDWLDKLVIAYNDSKVGAAGGWVRNHTGVEFQTKYIVSKRDATSENLIEDPLEVPDSKKYTEEFPGLIGVNSSFRKSFLLEIGGFDEEYAYFLDETDVLARMLDAGYLIKIIPNAEVHHKYAPSHLRYENGVARSWLQTMTSIAYYILKNALPDASLFKCMEIILIHKKNLINSTDFFLSKKMIDQVRHTELLSEIEAGTFQGIYDAFQPKRRLLNIDNYQPKPWKPLPRLLPPEHRLRIALVSPLYPPQPCGGVAVFIMILAKELVNLGHEVTIITQSYEKRGHTVDFEDGIWVHRLSENSTLSTELPESMPKMPEPMQGNAGRVLAELNRVNDRRDFQLVMGTIWDVDMAAVIASEKYLTAMYLVTTYKQMVDFKSEWKKDQAYYENIVCKMIDAEIWALKHVDYVLASTKAIVHDIEDIYEIEIDSSKVNILPFGLPKLSNSNENQIIPKLQNNSLLEVLFVGRFEHRKGIDLILEVMPHLLEENQHLCFKLIGDSSILGWNGHSYVDSFIKEHSGKEWMQRIKFLGYVDDAILESSYAGCDIFIAPSRYESFGLIYLEAMRFGKPCIGTMTGGIPSIVLNGETGLLIPPNDSFTLSAAIQKLLSDTSFRLRLGAAGKRRFDEHFTSESFASKFISLANSWIQTSTKKILNQKTRLCQVEL